MKGIILVFLIVSSLFSDTRHSLRNKDIKGAIEYGEESTKNGKYDSEAFALGDAYILANKFKKAEDMYLHSLYDISHNRNLDNHYKYLYELYPKKTKQLDKGWKILQALIIEMDAWRYAFISYPYRYYEWQENGIKTPTEAKKWTELRVTTVDTLKRIHNAGIKTSEEYRDYFSQGIKSVQIIKLLKSLNMKPNKLIGSMLPKSFHSKNTFLNDYNILKQNSCKEIESNFNDADEYDNEGKCYLFGAKMYQRLDRTHGLAITSNIFTGYGNIFYVIFNKSWRDGEIKAGIIKGLGNYKYQTSDGSMKNVSKGEVIMFR